MATRSGVRRKVVAATRCCRRRGGRLRRSISSLEASDTIAIVSGTRIGGTQDLVSTSYPLELDLRIGRVFGILIGVVAEGELFVGTLNICLRGVAGYSQDCIEVIISRGCVVATRHVVVDVVEKDWNGLTTGRY